MADRAPEKAFLDRKPDFDVVALHHGRSTVVRDRRLALGLGGQQLPGVFVLRVGEDLTRRSGLDDLALGHDADPVGDLAHDAEVMRDEQHRHADLAFEPGQQLQDLRLHGDVQRRRRLVGDQKLGFVGQRHGDHDALALPAGELVRIGVEPLFRVTDADLLEEFQRPRPRRLLAHAAMQLQDFHHLLRDRVQRVERGHRLLEDHGDLVAAHLPQLLLVGLQQVLSFEQDLPAWMAGRRVGQELQHRQRRHRLARTGFAHQRHRLALADVEGDVVDGRRHLAALRKGDGEVANGEERFGQGCIAMMIVERQGVHFEQSSFLPAH